MSDPVGPPFICDCGHAAADHRQTTTDDEITYPCAQPGCGCDDMGDLHPHRSPDVFGIETAECPCGGTRLGPMTGYTLSVSLLCPACGLTVEVVPRG